MSIKKLRKKLHAQENKIEQNIQNMLHKCLGFRMNVRIKVMDGLTRKY